MKESAFIFIVLNLLCSHVSSFFTAKFHRRPLTLAINSKRSSNTEDDTQGHITRRSMMITTPILASWFIASGAVKVYAADENEADSFESIAARAAKISATVEAETKADDSPSKPTTDLRTMYEFNLPVAGKIIPISELIGQDILPTSESNTVEPKVKAILFVNIKQDDPMARKNIPELITLASKYVTVSIYTMFHMFTRFYVSLYLNYSYLKI